MVYAVIGGVADRSEVLTFLGSLFTGNEAEPDSVFWSSIAGDIGDLYPAELMDVIRGAFERELIDPMFIDLDSFEEMLRDGQEKTLAQTREQMQRRSFDDLHARMSWWAMFDQEAEPLARKPAALPSAHQRQNQKKARRKMAKASQKKNRRRK